MKKTKRYFYQRIIRGGIRQFALSDIEFTGDSKSIEAQIKRIPNNRWISSYFLDGYENIEKRIVNIYKSMDLSQPKKEEVG